MRQVKGNSKTTIQFPTSKPGYSTTIKLHYQNHHKPLKSPTRQSSPSNYPIPLTDFSSIYFLQCGSREKITKFKNQILIYPIAKKPPPDPKTPFSIFYISQTSKIGRKKYLDFSHRFHVFYPPGGPLISIFHTFLYPPF